MRKLGLEWLWRIKEEPYLWRRYWYDGRVLLGLLVTRILPLAIWTWWLRTKYERAGQDLIVTLKNSQDSVMVSLSGPATAPHIGKIICAFRATIAMRKNISIDFSNSRAIDARFLGLLLMLRKKLKRTSANLILIGLSPGLQRVFRLNGLELLLSSNKSG
jgi:N-acetylglucosaminyldiphosphoundecaprenol N-acetyl-beta-D-mannosaminyltransferase